MSETRVPASEPRRSEKLHILAECAMLLAVSAVLSIFPKFKFLSYGGSVTLCSMLPVILASYRRGIKWGLLTGLGFALIQTVTGFTGSGMGVAALVVELLFDYLLAFTVIGLGGLFRGKLGSARRELLAGTALALTLRFACHVVSGYFVWGEYAEWFFSEAGAFGQQILAKFAGSGLMLVYSLIYNASYMLPELVITLLGAFFIAPLAMQGIGEGKGSPS